MNCKNACSEDRIIGELQEFKRSSDKRFDKIEEQLETLKSFRWNILGISGFLSVAISVLVQWLNKK